MRLFPFLACLCLVVLSLIGFAPAPAIAQTDYGPEYVIDGFKPLCMAELSPLTQIATTKIRPKPTDFPAEMLKSVPWGNVKTIRVSTRSGAADKFDACMARLAGAQPQPQPVPPGGSSFDDGWRSAMAYIAGVTSTAPPH